MNTFEAIAYIRRESLSRTDAMRYLMEKLGFSATYADEIIAVIFGDETAEAAGSVHQSRAH